MNKKSKINNPQTDGGFYIKNGEFYFPDSDNCQSLTTGAKSNFTIKPIAYMHNPPNGTNSIIFDIINTNNQNATIFTSVESISSLTKFKLIIESQGNFLFVGGKADFYKLHNWLLSNAKLISCEEITQLGWQKQGFWAWANGIYIPDYGNNGQFIPVDEYGIVSLGHHYFFLPAFSKIFEINTDLFHHERQFLFKKGSISSVDCFQLLHKVYGDKAIVALSFLFASLFRDVFFDKFYCFPILNLFGPKGTGKSNMAVALLKFFGNQSRGPNIANSTKSGMADHLSSYSNAIAYIDEYKNSIDADKVELLKSVYDGIGRTKINTDSIKGKETSKVNAGLVLCGQEMPIMDVALCSRIVSLPFNKSVFSIEDKILFEHLKIMQNDGLGQIVHEILDLRFEFVQHFFSLYQQGCNMFRSASGKLIAPERIVQSYAILFSAAIFVFPRLKNSFSVKDIVDVFVSSFLVHLNLLSIHEVKKSSIANEIVPPDENVNGSLINQIVDVFSNIGFSVDKFTHNMIFSISKDAYDFSINFFVKEMTVSGRLTFNHVFQADIFENYTIKNIDELKFLVFSNRTINSIFKFS